MALTVNTVFDGVFCINLDRRRDRWEQALEAFESVSIRVERVSAVDGKELSSFCLMAWIFSVFQK